MTTRMLIDARHPEETRVAVVKGSRVEEFDFEAADRKQIKGNIYLAKVTRVEPSLQAAFVDYGGNRHGFLAFSEIHPDYYQIPREDRERLLREEQAIEAEEAEASHDDRYADDAIDDDYADEVETIAVDAVDDPDEPAVAPTRHEDHHHNERLRERRMALRRRYKIQDVIKRRQVLLVQVVKEERGNKGAALTTYLSLAGRYCVLMPNTSHGGGISRKISSISDRRKLKAMIDELGLPQGMACIVRTAGLSRSRAEIHRDFDYLTRLWDDIRELTLHSNAPKLIHEDSDLIKRSVRDVYNRDIEEILVEGEGGYRQARDFMRLLMPGHGRRVKQYVDAIPLFQRGQVEGQLNAMFNPVVQLKSGGYIVINQTEALVAIDINSGRSTREHNIEETAYKTNCEAAEEIARQLRLRDMAGLIVIDFIDMENGGNVRRVERVIKDALRHDRARIQVGRISSFGLLEMSRQRLRTGLLEASTHSCPMCAGAGVVRSVPSAALAAIRGLEEEAVRGRHGVLKLRAADEVAIYLLNRKRADIVEIEEHYGVHVDIAPDEALTAAHFEIDASGPPPERGDRPSLSSPPVILEEDDPSAPEDFDDDEPFDPIDERDAEREPVRGRAAGAPRDGDRGGERGGRKRRKRRGGGARDDARDDAPARTDSAEPDLEPLREAEPVDADAPSWEDGGTDGDPARKRRRRGRRGGKNRDAARDDAARAIALDGDDTDAVVFIEPLAPEPMVDDADAEPYDVPADLAPPAPVPAEPAPKARAKRGSKKVEPAEAAEAEPAKPKRARKPKAEPAATEAPAETPAGPDGETPAPKPKRGRRKADEATDASASAPAPEQAVTEPAAAPRRGRARIPKAEIAAADAPEPEPVALAAPGARTPAPATDAAAPPSEASGRKGWWQRTFG